jgi:Plasmid pRiA4b ORF-3-like protein
MSNGCGEVGTGFEAQTARVFHGTEYQLTCQLDGCLERTAVVAGEVFSNELARGEIVHDLRAQRVGMITERQAGAPVRADPAADQRRFGCLSLRQDPSFGMEDERAIAVGGVFFGPRKVIRYVYDFGDNWRHEIKLERVLAAEPGLSYPVCVAGSGAVPVEDSGYLKIKFDQDDINRRLGGLPVEEGNPMLEKVAGMILVDAYGEDEQLAAFRTVFEDVVEVPAKATVLGHPIEVLEFDYAEPLRGLFVKCREGEVSLVDVCFPPDTVAAWIHAAYRDFLGLEPFPAIPRPDWTWPGW